MEAANENQNPNRITNEGGQVRLIEGPKAINIFACRAVMLGMRLYLESNGRMMANRSYTPTNMRAFAARQTGKTYARSRKGLETAYADMQALLAAPETFDGVDIVNKTSPR